jgi:hypothetical protein
MPECFTIGVNHACEQFPCDLVVCQDSQIFKYRKFRSVVENRKTFVVTGLTRPTSRLSTPKTSGYYYWREQSEQNSDWHGCDPTHVLRTPSVLSGSQAVVLAHALGFGPIVCLGFDANSEKGCYTYGFSHPKWGGALAVTKARQQMIDNQCDFLESNAAELNLINCSDGRWRSKTNYEKVLDLVRSKSEGSRSLVGSVWLANMRLRNPTAAQNYESKSDLRSSSNGRLQPKANR